MKNSTTSSRTKNLTAPSHEEISQRAQQLWEKYNRPSDRDEKIWLEAERQLASEASGDARNNIMIKSSALP